MPIPRNLRIEAAKAALAGGPDAVKRFMRQEGHPMSGAWCGEFVASVFHHSGLPIPNHPEIASNWRNVGPEHNVPQEGDIAVRRFLSNRGGASVPTGREGSHVTMVGGYDPSNARFTAIGGNQGRYTPGSYPTSSYQFYGAPPTMDQSLLPPAAYNAPSDVAPTAYQSPDGTFSGGPTGAASAGLPPIFSDSSGLWNAPIEPTMSLDGSGAPPASQEIVGSSYLPTSPPDYSGNQYIDSPDPGGSPPLPNPSLSLSPLVNADGNYQAPNSPAAASFASDSAPSSSPGSDTSGATSGASGGIPDYFSGLDGSNLPVSNLSARPLDSFTDAALHPSSTWGSGGPTQRGVGMIVGTASNLLLPGSGFITGPIARLVTRLIQGGASPAQAKAAATRAAPTPAPAPPMGPPGGLTMPNGFNPFGGLPAGFTQVGSRENPGQFQNTPRGQAQEDPFSPGGYAQDIGGAPTVTGPVDFGPNFTGDSIFGGRTNLSMALPGSFSHLGEGSAGNLGNYDYFGQMSLRRLLQGGDPSLGFEGFNHIPTSILPVGQWGGYRGGGSGDVPGLTTVGTSINPDFPARSAK
jgi:hypothetical protein